MDLLGKVPGLLTISVVSHRQASLVNQLFYDLSRFDSISLDHLIVTENAAAGVELQMPLELEQRFRVVRNPTPKGFAANHNAAFAYCNTEWFAVLNPDIRLPDDPFDHLISQAQPGDAILAPALFDPRTGEVAPNRGLLTPWEVIRRRLPGWRPPDTPAWLPGAFLLIRAQAFREVGGFDERYFLYAEDFDLCARLRLAGWRLRYVPEVRVIHAAQRSSHVRWRYLLWHVQSLLRLWSSRVFWRYRALLRREARAARRPG